MDSNDFDWTKLEPKPVHYHLVCPDNEKGIRQIMKLADYFSFQSHVAISYDKILDHLTGRTDRTDYFEPRMGRIIFRENKKRVVNNPKKYFKKFLLEKENVSILIATYLDNARKRIRLALFCTVLFQFDHRSDGSKAGYLKIVDSPGKTPLLDHSKFKKCSIDL